MGFDKLFAPLEGRPVVAHAIAAFERTQSVEGIIIVGRAEGLSDFEALVAHEGFGKVSAIIPGGARRQDSVRCGLAQVKPEAEFVAVHDAARPCITDQWIDAVFEAARRDGAAILASPVQATLKKVDQKKHIAATVDRESLWEAQTPQVFRRELLIEAYAKRGRDPVTDDAQLIERLGKPVTIVPCSPLNIKITTRDDLKLAEQVLKVLPKPKLEGFQHPFAGDDLWR